MKTISKLIILILFAGAAYIGTQLFLDGETVIGGYVLHKIDQELPDKSEQVEVEPLPEAEEAGKEDDDIPSRVEIYKGLPAVRLPEENLELGGIQISSLQLVQHLPEIRGAGVVIDFLPLLEKQMDYQKTQAELELALESRKTASHIYERLRVLYKERANVALRQVEQARLKLVEITRREQSARQMLRNIRKLTEQQWGKVLTSWALGKETGSGNEPIQNSNYFDRLVNGEDLLIRIALPPDTDLPEETSFIYVNMRSDRSTARKAYLISKATRADPVSQGATWFFRTSAVKLRIGMRLNAWISVNGEVEKGVDVPLDAVIWYGGQPWVYVQVGEDLYQRRPVMDYRETDFGWFILDAFSPNEKIVIRGGQLLLSEELRWQIPDEDDD